MSKIINGVASEYEMPTSRCKTLEDLVNNYEKHIKYHNYEFDELSYKLLILDIKKILQENQQLKDKINTYENPEDLTLMFMYCDEKAKDKIKQLKELINGIREERDYLFNKSSVENKQIQQEKDLYKSVIEEVRECIEKSSLEVNTKEFGNLTVCNSDDLLQILDKVKGE